MGSVSRLRPVPALRAALSGISELGAPLERVPPILVPDVERTAHDRLALECTAARFRRFAAGAFADFARRHHSRPEREAQHQKHD